MTLVRRLPADVRTRVESERESIPSWKCFPTFGSDPRCPELMHCVNVE
jgi:hypothetical protein